MVGATTPGNCSRGPVVLTFLSTISKCTFLIQTSPMDSFDFLLPGPLGDNKMPYNLQRVFGTSRTIS
jgi:hypothetical protein